MIKYFASIILVSVLFSSVLIAQEKNSLSEEKNPYPHFHYLKWSEGFLENNNYQKGLDDLIKRSNFDVLFIGSHWIEKKYNLHNPEYLKALSTTCNMLHNAGRKFVIDIDIRNEAEAFSSVYPGKTMKLIKFVEFDLNEQGSGEVTVEALKTLHWGASQTKPVSDILNAWSFNAIAPGEYKSGSLQKITQKLKITQNENKSTTLAFDGTQSEAGKRVIVAVAFPNLLPDYFSPEFLTYFEEMFKLAGTVPADGAYIDEWGIYSGSPITGEVHSFPYSDNMDSQYFFKYGMNLKEQLVYFKYSDNQHIGQQVNAVNSYLEFFRDKMGNIETWFYNETKKTFGPQAIIGQHPTWVCQPQNLRWEFIFNGLSWWQSKRDYGFSDESLNMGMRLSLCHKWESNIWYNMYYGDSIHDIRNFYREAYDYAAFGGRLFYLGYECPEVGVLQLREKNYLEEINKLELKIKEINNFQKTAPDSRIAIIFSIEASGNWILQRNNNFKKANEEVIDLSERLRKMGYLSDLIPSSEVSNGSVKLNNGKLQYGSQTYDGVIVYKPESVHKEFVSFFNNYSTNNPNTAIVGNITLFSNGQTDADLIDAWYSKAGFRFESMPTDANLTEMLKNWNVPQTAFTNGCIYTDGSVIFTAKLELGKPYKSVGNLLKVDQTIKGHRVEFEGEDFICIDLDENGTIKRFASGKTKLLKINGKKANVL